VESLAKLLIPLALLAAVLVAATTAPGTRTHAKPAPARSLQLHR